MGKDVKISALPCFFGNGSKPLQAANKDDFLFNNQDQSIRFRRIDRPPFASSQLEVAVRCSRNRDGTNWIEAERLDDRERVSGDDFCCGRSAVLMRRAHKRDSDFFRSSFLNCYRDLVASPSSRLHSKRWHLRSATLPLIAQQHEIG